MGDLEMMGYFFFAVGFVFGAAFIVIWTGITTDRQEAITRIRKPAAKVTR